MRFKNVLARESGGYKVSIPPIVLSVSNSVPHVTTNEDKNGDQADGLPNDFALNQGKDESSEHPEHNETANGGSGQDNVGDRVERFVELKSMGNEGRQPVVQVVGTKATARS